MKKTHQARLGLKSFTVDVDIFSDEKMMAISKEFGIKGEIAVIRLLCAIYRNGYFILWDDKQRKALLMNMPGVSSELLDTIVQRLVRWGFFDKDLFYSTGGVLTSRSIQRRYFTAVKRRRMPADLPYLIVGDGDSPMVSTVDGKGVKDADAKAGQREDENAWYNNLCGDRTFLETAAMRFHISVEEVKRGMYDLNLENIAKDKTHMDYKDYRYHAFDYLRIWVQNKNKENGNKQNRRGGTETTAVSEQDFEGSF